jgi:hypothetical protein
MEYRGPIDEVVTDVSVELIGEPTRGDVHPMVAAAIERAKSLTPVAMTAPRPSGPPPRRKLNPDASLEFPHPLNPALYGDDAEHDAHHAHHAHHGEHYGLEAFESMVEDELPPPRREVPRWRFVAVAGVMTLAAIVIGLALGSHAHVTTASASESDAPRPAAQTPAKKAPAAETTAAKSTETPAAPVAAPAVAAPTTGHITSPKWAKDRHTFMDGKEVGRSGDLEVACGAHVVQVGLKGKPRKVKIPCGGSVVVLP